MTKLNFLIVPVLFLVLLLPVISKSDSGISETKNTPTFIQRIKNSDFFLIRIFTKNRIAADSIVQHVETVWGSANTLYSQRKFLEASKTAEQIIPSWNSYQKSLKRVHKKSLFDEDKLKSFVRISKVYNNICPSVISLTNLASTLPSDEVELIERNRHDLLAQLESVRKEIQDTVSHYPQERQSVLYSYRFILASVQKVDSLFGIVYDQERLNFSLKNKYYYNRMQESNHPDALKRFVDDCDYYGVDKEWCERARKILHPETKTTTSFESASITVPSGPKVPGADSVNQQFTIAVTSKSVDLLETYIKKYSSKKYRKIAQLDSAKIVLNAIRKEIESEKVFSSDHPYFSDSEDFDRLFTVQYQGLQEHAVSVLHPIIDSFTTNLKSIRALRFPAVLIVNYSAVPPLYLLNGYAHEKKDLTSSDSSGQSYCTVVGIGSGLSALDQLTRRCTEELKRNGIQYSYPPIFAVRVLKNSQAYITMYGSPRLPDGYELYNFYDVTVPNVQNMRIQHESKSIKILIPPDRNTPENRACRDFFDK
jgi:hypothetical protein